MKASIKISFQDASVWVMLNGEACTPAHYSYYVTRALSSANYNFIASSASYVTSGWGVFHCNSQGEGVDSTNLIKLFPVLTRLSEKSY